MYNFSPIFAASNIDIECSLEGNLPPGLEYEYEYDDEDVDFRACFFWIEGTPTQIGTYTFTVKAKNDVGSNSKEFTIVIAVPGQPVITTTTLPNGEIGVDYERKIGVDVVGADGIITWSLESDELPPGLVSFDEGGDGYTISGTPTQTGTYSFTLKAENDVGNDTKEFTIEITERQPPVITTTTLPNGKVGMEYGFFPSVVVIVANGSNITWSLESGKLPPGLEFGLRIGDEVVDGSDNFISGIPTEAGTYIFTVKAENDIGIDTKSFTIIIDGDPEPILPQIAGSGNLITQARNSINLAAKTNATIEVYNLSGKLISRQSYLAGNHSISFGHLPKGMYVVKASFGKEKQVLRMPVR
jgi:PKD repeat protein